MMMSMTVCINRIIKLTLVTVYAALYCLVCFCLGVCGMDFFEVWFGC